MINLRGVIMNILEQPTTECDCAECKQMCLRPCWASPEEAETLIDAGLGNRLMLDYWVRHPEDIMLLCPAIKGSEGRNAPFMPIGECTFFNKEGHCDLHDKKLKPIEGRIANCKSQTKGELHEAVAFLWLSPKGRAVIERWKVER